MLQLLNLRMFHVSDNRVILVIAKNEFTQDFISFISHVYLSLI